MLKNLFIVWEMAKALNLQIKDSVYNFKLQGRLKTTFVGFVQTPQLLISKMSLQIFNAN